MLALLGTYSFTLQTILYLQPDAKVQNGIYWANFWLDTARWLLS